MRNSQFKVLMGMTLVTGMLTLSYARSSRADLSCQAKRCIEVGFVPDAKGNNTLAWVIMSVEGDNQGQTYSDVFVDPLHGYGQNAVYGHVDTESKVTGYRRTATFLQRDCLVGPNPMSGKVTAKTVYGGERSVDFYTKCEKHEGS